jgi:hypothetical protein
VVFFNEGNDYFCACVQDCGVKCRNQGDLTAHLGSCSKRPKVVRGKNITAFVCVTCGCQFTTEPEVKEHVVKHVSC